MLCLCHHLRNGQGGAQDDVIAGESAVCAIVDALVGKKVGDTVTLSTKGLFKEDYLLSGALGIARDKADGLKVDVTFTIEEINEREPAALDQELFDKLFGEGKVTSEKELKDKIKEDSEKQFEQQSDQKLLNDITEKLIDETKFELPSEFLKKWIQISGENPLTEDEAKEEFEKSQLINVHNSKSPFSKLMPVKSIDLNVCSSKQFIYLVFLFDVTDSDKFQSFSLSSSFREAFMSSIDMEIVLPLGIAISCTSMVCLPSVTAI